MEEIWRDIKGFEGKYQVSDFGRVRSLNYGNHGYEQIMVGFKDRHGYLSVELYKDGKRKKCKVHRLVAEAFIPNPDNLPQVNHKDECKTNNIVTNLEYCDAKYNSRYGTRTERLAKAQSKTVYQYTLDGSFVRSYPSTQEATRRTGYPNSNIVNCCNGKYKQVYGYIWSYTLL